MALRFVDALETAFSQLSEQPQLGRTQEWLSVSLRGCRRWRVATPFDVYQIFYCASDTHIDVVRVLHGARDLESILEADGELQ